MSQWINTDFPEPFSITDFNSSINEAKIALNLKYTNNKNPEVQEFLAMLPSTTSFEIAKVKFIAALKKICIPGVERCIVKEIDLDKKETKSLKNIAADYVKKNKNTFFKQLEKLPESLREEHPELEINHKNIFVRAIKNILTQASSKLDQTTNKLEFKYFDKLYSVLANKDSAYNEIHKIICDLKKQSKKIPLSLFTQNMKTVRESIVQAMKQYNENKKIYNQHYKFEKK